MWSSGFPGVMGMHTKFTFADINWLALLLYVGSNLIVFEHAASVTAALPICVTRLLERDHLLFRCDRESCVSPQNGTEPGGHRAKAAVGQEWFGDRDPANRAHCACGCGVCVVATNLYIPAEFIAVNLPVEVHWANLLLGEQNADFRTDDLLRPPRPLV